MRATTIAAVMRATTIAAASLAKLILGSSWIDCKTAAKRRDRISVNR
jgi:hypothetical protein